MKQRRPPITWKHIFPDFLEFRRERYGPPPNNLLNYGYAILRALVARSLTGSGLLPTLGIHHRNQYNAYCLADGFNMFQFTIYLRHCASRESADVHIARVKKILPPKGHVGIMCITDKQFGMMEIFRGKDLIDTPDTVQQLELF